MGGGVETGMPVPVVSPVADIAAPLIAPPVPSSQSPAGPISLWHNFQSLPLEYQISITIAVITGVIAALKWAIDKRVESSRFRQEQLRLDRQEQQTIVEKQAEWRFNPDANAGNLLSIGSFKGFLRLMGTLQNVGMATARLRNVQAFIDDREMPWDTSAPRQGDVLTDYNAIFRFQMPFRIEEVDRENWKANTLLDGKIVRIVVTYADGTGDREPFVRCFRFELSPQFQRWNIIEVDPCPPVA